MTDPRRVGAAFVVLSAFGYSTFPVFVRGALDAGMAPAEVAGWRFAIAVPAVWCVAAAAGQARGNDVPARSMLAAGLLFGVPAVAGVAALQRLPASLYVVVLYTYPAMVTLAGVARGRRPNRPTAVALVLATLGVVLVVPNVAGGFGGVDRVGLALVLLNAAAYAAYILLTGRILAGRHDLVAASALSLTGSSVLAVGLALAAGPAVPPSTTAWASVVAMALVATVLGGTAFLAGLERLGPTTSAILATAEPVMGLVWAVTILGEHLQPVQVLGAALVLASVVLLQAAPAARLRRAPATSG